MGVPWVVTLVSGFRRSKRKEDEEPQISVLLRVEGGGDSSQRARELVERRLNAPGLSFEEVDKAHDKLSDLVEDSDVGTDEIRGAAVELCVALVALQAERERQGL